MAPRIEFRCPSCDRVNKVPAELAGKQGRCPGCRKLLEVPDPAARPPAPSSRPRRSSAPPPPEPAGFDLASDSGEEEAPAPPPSAPPRAPDPVQAPAPLRSDPGPLPEEEAPAPASAAPGVPLLVFVAMGANLLLPPLGFVLGLVGLLQAHRRRKGVFLGWLALAHFFLTWALYHYFNFNRLSGVELGVPACLLLGVLHQRRLLRP